MKKNNWICGKCDQEAGKYPNGEKLPKHSLHCSKRLMTDIDKSIERFRKKFVQKHFAGKDIVAKGLSESKFGTVTYGYWYPKDIENFLRQELLAVRESTLKSVEKDLGAFDYYCDDGDCCSSDIVSGVRDLLAELARKNER